MKKIIALLFLASVSHAGTITTAFSPLGTITFSSGTNSSIPIAIDSQTVSPSGTGGSSPMTWSMTIGSGSNRFLALGCSTAFGVISGITINGTPLVLSTQAVINLDPNAASIWTLVAPPSGSQSIVVTWAGSSNHGVYCAATSFTGVNQSSPIDVSTASFNSPGTGTQTATLTTITKNDMLFDAIEDRQGTGDTVGGGQTAFGAFVDGVQSGGTSTKTSTNAGAYSMSWTTVNGGAGGAVANVIIAIAPAIP